MAKKLMYSSRLEKDFELEVCEAVPGSIVGDATDIVIVRAAALESLLFNELANVVDWKWTETSTGAIIVDIKDDTGVHVAGVGDNNYKSLKNKIAQEFPVSTAWSRAISAAVVKYLGFEGRVYSDASFEIESDKEPAFSLAEQKITPIAEETDVMAESESDTENEAEVVEVVVETTTETLKEAKTSEKDIEDTVFTMGKGKGFTLREIVENKNGNLGVQYLKYMLDSGYLKGAMRDTVKQVIDKYLDE